MQINDDFLIEDEVSGLRISVQKGERLDRLHIERMFPSWSGQNPPAANRDFFFTKEGVFDGTGTAIA